MEQRAWIHQTVGVGGDTKNAIRPDAALADLRGPGKEFWMTALKELQGALHNSFRDGLGNDESEQGGPCALVS